MGKNTPSKRDYWRGRGGNPRTICSKCGRYMFGSKSLITVENKRKWAVNGEVCKCGNFIPDTGSLETFPE